MARFVCSCLSQIQLLVEANHAKLSLKPMLKKYLVCVPETLPIDCFYAPRRLIPTFLFFSCALSNWLEKFIYLLQIYFMLINEVWKCKSQGALEKNIKKNGKSP